MTTKIGVSQADLDSTWARNENDWVFQKYATEEEKKEYKNRINNKDKTSEEYLKKVSLKYYDQAKKDYQVGQAKIAEEARKAANVAKEKAKPKNDYEEWKASQQNNKTKGWLSSIESFIKNNAGLIVGVTGLIAVVGGIAALTPTLKNALSSLKDMIKNKRRPTPEEQAEIDKNPKSISMKMYSFIRDSEEFTPFVKQQGYTLKLGFGYIVETSSPYYTIYPARDDKNLASEYMEHVKDDTINEWIQTIKPNLAPKEMIYNLFNRDIQSMETVVNTEITDVLLEQNEFDALVSFLWSMRDEGKIYEEFAPERLIKEIHSLLYYDETKEAVASYMRDVDKKLVQSSKIWNRRQAEITLFLTGNYECLNMEVLEKEDYDEVFSDMKNQYLEDKSGNKNLDNFTSYVGNDSVPESLNACREKNIILPQSQPTVRKKTPQSPNEILNQDIVSKMIYPVYRNEGMLRGGYNNTGINTNDIICAGWFGSERGEGQAIHFGIDLVCDKNNPIVLPYSGTIEFIGYATETTSTLKRVVFRPDYNTDIVISLYYVVNLQVSVHNHYNAGKLVGYIGDCSELFETVRHDDDFVPFDFLHIQANYNDEKGVPLNLTDAIDHSKNADEPSEITALKNTPLVNDSVTGTNKPLSIVHPGRYQIICVGKGGDKTTGTLNPISVLPVTEASPYKYSLVGTQGAYVKVEKFLPATTYSYTVNGTNETSFNHEVITEKGKDAHFTNDITDTQVAANFTVDESYRIIESAKGNICTAISNICGYDVQTGQTQSFVIQSSLGSPYLTYGKGGDVGLNGGTPNEPTSGIVVVQYINWN